MPNMDRVKTRLEASHPNGGGLYFGCFWLDRETVDSGTVPGSLCVESQILSREEVKDSFSSLKPPSPPTLSSLLNAFDFLPFPPSSLPPRLASLPLPPAARITPGCNVSPHPTSSLLLYFLGNPISRRLVGPLIPTATSKQSLASKDHPSSSANKKQSPCISREPCSAGKKKTPPPRAKKK